MANLDRLIAELCPNGVEYETLGQTAVRTKGTPITAAQMKALNKPNAPIKIFAGGKTVAYFNYADLPEKDVNTHPSVVVKSRGVIEFEYYDKPFSHKNEMWSYHSERDDVDIKFVYYFLKTQEKKLREKATSMGTFPQIAIPDTEQLRIPFPPLPIQREIVRILDNFTALTAALTEELTARRKQYEYYRNELLNTDGESYSLEDVCQIVDCPHTSPKWQPDGVPVIRNYNLISGNIDTSNMSYVDETEYKERTKRITPQTDDILFSREAPIGNVGIIPEDFLCCQGQRVVLLRSNKEIAIPRYLLYALQGAMVKEQIYRVEKVGSTVSNFNIADLRRLRLSVPAIPIQRIIVDKLDAFNGLCVDSVAGLPAEIAARQKQYEYYRDKLLTFKPLVP